MKEVWSQPLQQKKAFCLSRAKTRPKVDAKLYTLLWSSAVLKEIPVTAHEVEMLTVPAG